MKTILIVGLGNPGKEYFKTRHNAGFMFVDSFWKNFRDEFGPPTNFIDERVKFSDWKFSKKINSDISTGKISGNKIILLKPQTLMNLSGEAVKAALKFYKVKLSDLIVVHDEIDLPIETFRFSTDSSAAGHKGAQDVIDRLGTKNFTRLRIGVENRRDNKTATEKYVLGKFLPAELKQTSKVIFESSEKIKQLILNS